MYKRQPKIIAVGDNHNDLEMLQNSDIPCLVKNDKFLKKNLQKLLIWMNVGTDIENGWWSCFGARQGCYLTMCTDWDIVNTRDFEYLNELWANRDEMPEDVVHSEIYNLGDSLIQGLDIPIAVQPLNEEQSAFFKTVYQNPARSSDQQFVIDKE